MVIRTHKTTDPFARVPKDLLSDKRLSWKAKGLLSYLLSKPNDWIVQVRDVINQSTDGRDAVKAAFRELRDAGYAFITSTPQGREWHIADSPRATDGKAVCGPQTENPSMAFPPITKKENTTKNKPESASIPENLNTLSFTNSWADWCQDRRDKRQPITETAAKRQLAKLAAMGEKRAIAAIDFSITQGYTGIFEQNSNGTHKQSTTESTRNTGTANEGKSSQYAGVGKTR